MRLRRYVAIVGALVLAVAGAFQLKAEPVEVTRAPASIVFVCRNGVAMSVWSAAYFNRLAAARGLRERAVARAATPSFAEVPFRMIVALAIDGFRLGGFRPHVISADDAQAAELVVAIDTDLPAEVRPSVSESETWQGFPPMRERYFPSRAALKAKVESLVEHRVNDARPAAWRVVVRSMAVC